MGSGEYRLRNQKTAKVAQAGPRGGSWLTQVTYTGARRQHWRVEDVGTNWRIVNVESGRRVHLMRPGNMANLIVAACGNAPTQLWNLPPA